jgi:5,10-methylenetetrahydromethanopterin reductase
VRSLPAGEAAGIDGQPCQMRQLPGFGPAGQPLARMCTAAVRRRAAPRRRPHHAASHRRRRTRLGQYHHSAWEHDPATVDDRPGGNWRRAGIEARRPQREQHLDVHQGHLTTLTARDRDLAVAASPALRSPGWTGTPAHIRNQAAQAAASGVTEIVYVPTWPDVTAELTAYAEAIFPP